MGNDMRCEYVIGVGCESVIDLMRICSSVCGARNGGLVLHFGPESASDMECQTLSDSHAILQRLRTGYHFLISSYA